MILRIPTIGIAIQSGDTETEQLLLRFKRAAMYSFVDAILVGGVTFFSSMAVSGYDNLLMSIKIALISSVVTAGLTFFTEMRYKIKYKPNK